MKRETQTSHQKQEDKGDQMLKPHLLPGEEFITNSLKRISDIDLTTPAFQARRTAVQIRDALLSSEKYDTVRILDVAYSRNGIELPTYAAIVAKRKIQTP